MISRALVPVLIALSLATCAVGDAPPKSSATVVRSGEQQASSPQNDAGLPLGTLAPRKLNVGECGMFLWARNAERNLVFFNTRGGAGRMVLDGQEVSLTRVAADGAEVLGQFEQQTFSYDGLAIELQLQFESRPGLARGAVIPQGALRLKRNDGWEYIQPVAGLVGCEEA